MRERYENAGGRPRAGRVILTVALAAIPPSLTAYLFNREHIRNPAWHPHARFHAVQLVGSGAAAAAVGLWTLWRPTREPRSAAITAAALAAAPPLSEFAALLVPGTSPIPDSEHPNTVRIAGRAVPGNLLAFAGHLVITAVGLGLALRPACPARRRSSAD